MFSDIFNYFVIPTVVSIGAFGVYCLLNPQDGTNLLKNMAWQQQRQAIITGISKRRACRSMRGPFSYLGFPTWIYLTIFVLDWLTVLALFGALWRSRPVPA